MRGRSAANGRGKPFDILVLDVDLGRERFLDRCPAQATTDVEDQILHNAVVIELGKTRSEIQENEPGNYILFVIDRDGFILDEDSFYMLPLDVRDGNTFAFVEGHPHGDGVYLVTKAELAEP